MTHSLCRNPLSLLLVAVMLLLGSCRNSTTNIHDLLATLPKDASTVVAFNVHSSLEKAGCKIDGSKVELSPEMKAALDKTNNPDVRQLFNGEYGIDPEAVVIFIEGRDVYLTGFLARPDDFVKAVSQQTGAPFEGNGVKTSRNYAYKDNQFWISLSNDQTIHSSEVERFLSLSERLSFTANDYADSMVDLSHDIQGWSNIVGIVNAIGLDFQERQFFRMGLETLFDDAVDLTFTADFDKGSFTSITQIINSKGKPAKFLLPADKIDVSTISGDNGSAGLFMAVALPEKLMQEISQQVEGKGFSLLGAIMPMFKCIDGTSLLRMGIDGRIAGLITTTGQNTASLTDLLTSQFGLKVNKDGKILHFSQGEVSGPLTNNDVAPDFMGATIGMVVSPGMNQGDASAHMGLRKISAMLEGYNGSMQLRITATSNNEKENILISILEAGSMPSVPSSRANEFPNEIEEHHSPES